LKWRADLPVKQLQPQGLRLRLLQQQTLQQQTGRRQLS
jgi:hypothetical protein